MGRLSDLQQLKQIFSRVSPSTLDVIRLRGERSYDDLRTGLIANGVQYEWKPSGKCVYGPQRVTMSIGPAVLMSKMFSLRTLRGKTYVVANMLAGGTVKAYEVDVNSLKDGFFIEDDKWERENEIIQAEA